MSLANDKTMVNIGRLTSAVGLKGEIKVMTYAEESENIYEGAELHVDVKDKDQVMEVVSIRYQKNRPVVKLSGVNDRNGAEELRNCEVYISEDDLVELDDGEIYIRDLIGLEVYDRFSEQTLGKVEDIISNPTQDIYRVVSEDGKEILIPAVEAFEREFDLERGVIEVELIPGFLD